MYTERANEMTLTQLCRELKNYFDYDRREGIYTVSDGTLVLDGVQPGQYFRIAGSVFNDGVYSYPALGLHDETFDGVIWYMKVPNELVELADEISAWQEENAKALSGPYQSESFGGYSYTKKTGGRSSGGGDYTWQDAFETRLKHWRKICPY